MKTLKTIMAVAALFLCSAMASAFEVDGINYSVLSSTDKTVSVTSTIDEYSGDIVIPSTVVYNGVEYSVTSIGSCAFRNWQALTSVTIPNSVTSIGPSAFEFCLGLTSVTIPNSVTSIGLSAFYKCTSLTSVEIPNSVTTIDIGAFGACSGLTEVVIGNGVKVIGDEAFYGCSKLTSVTMGDNVKSIGSSAFQECPNLTSITIPNSVTNIGAAAFSCSGLTSVIIGSNVASIDYEAFYNCSNLTSITIPNSVTNIGNNAFAGCSSVVVTMESKTPASLGGSPFDDVKSIIVPDAAYDAYVSAWSAYASKIKKTILKDGMIFEMDGVYYNVTSSTNKTVMVVAGENKYSGEVVIPVSVTYEGVDLAVTSIGSRAFYNCFGLTSVTIPSSVTSIGENAFSYCSGLKEITIPNSVTNIGGSAFSYCSGLTSVAIPNSVASIGSNAFYKCSGLKEVHISDVAAWCNIEFGSSYDEASNPLRFADNLYLGDEEIKDLVIPEGVTAINARAFYEFDGLTSVTIPNSVTSIGENAFYHCSLKEVHISDIAAWCNITFANASSNPLYQAKHLFLGDEEIKDLVIPEGVTAIKNYAFQYCSDLTSVAIPNSVTSIGESAFDYCSRLKEITIPSSVTNIGGSAFSSARLVEMKSEVAPECTSNPVSAYALVVIPDGAYDSYSQAEYWKDYANKIVEKSDAVKTVTIEAADAESSLHKAIGEENLAKVVALTINGSINSYDFMVMRNKMTFLRKVDMSNAKIVYNAYEHYTGYHTVNDKFPDYAFYNSDLISIDLPKDITSIGEHAFSSCSGLTSVTIPNSVTSIGYSAFYQCSGLTSVTIPNSVTSIGSYAFYQCSNLTSVIMGNSVTTIDSKAFYHCIKLSSIKLPPSLKKIGNDAFYDCSALTEIRIPASVRTLGGSAFYSCDNLKSVYVYTVEPISISQSTFDFGASQVLYAPKVSYTTYWYNTQWSQFKEIREFDEPYENFYLNGDKELDNSTGAIEGEGDNNPDAEMGSGSGLIVGGDVNQDLGDVEIENGGSIIVDGTGCVNADKLHFHINVTGGKWYFFCFPFDIKAEDIKCKNGSDYVFRYYDGEERAKNGKGGWKNVTSDGSGNFIKAGRGYIFQSSATDVLCITAKNGKIKKEDKYNELVEFITQNVHDASWNFVGNPYLSYYEVTNEDYNAPITIWNGSGYEAIRPGDDDYHLAPFEAFFVQKPNGEDQVNYDNDRQMTKNQSDKKKAEKAAEARMRGGVRMLDNGRKMVNITLSDGTATDRTRVVFNESVSMDYEMECDAAKFASAGIPQVYTLDSKQVKYAINERPVAEGMVAVGYSVENQGVYTIAAQRMDTQMVLKDNLTGKIHDFATDGDYTFMTEAGTFDARFALMLKDGEATGIEGVEGGMKVEAVDGGVAVSGSGNTLVNVYNAGGAVVASQNGDGTISLPAGTYIVSAGEKNVKVTLK